MRIVHVPDHPSGSRRALAGLALLGFALAGPAAASEPAASALSTKSDELLPRSECLHDEHDLSNAFARVAESIRPSVVSIRSSARMKAQPMPFHPWFGPGREAQPGQPQEGPLREGLGTGFVLDPSGYILTNNHVVDGAEQVEVTLWNDTVHLASVVGTDPKTDLAVLRIEAADLVPAPLGDSRGLEVGHWVAAVGNPFGLSSTMTAGIVSAVGRSRMGVADYEDFIQTDAAINPGNSGGPLVNLDGEVVGVNTAIFSRSGGYMGIGFAIPIDLARSIAGSLIDDGRVERGYLGVVIQDLDEGLARSFGFVGTDGVLVSDVAGGGPAEAAGLRAGDIVLRIGDESVVRVDQLRLLVAQTEPGTTLPLELHRDGRRLVLEVEVGELEPAGTPAKLAERSEELGMKVTSLTPELAARLRLEEGASGALVTQLQPLGAAARAGLRQNDLIVAVGDRAIASARDLAEALEAANLDEGVRVTVRSGPARRFVFLRLPD